MDEKPLLGYEDISVGLPLGPLRYRVSPELVRANLAAVGQPVPACYEESGHLMIEPGLYVRHGIRLLRDRFRTAGVIHARAEVNLQRPARAGQVLTVTGRVADKYVRRDRRYVVVESATRDEEGREVSRERNTLILRDGEG